MGLEVRQEAAIPPGPHNGVIIGAELTTKVFDPAKGPEQTVIFTIQPEWRLDDETTTLPVTVGFSPVVNGISGLSKMLKRLGKHPAKGTTWEPAETIGTEVSFVAGRTNKDFVNVLKDTIKLRERPAKK